MPATSRCALRLNASFTRLPTYASGVALARVKVKPGFPPRAKVKDLGRRLEAQNLVGREIVEFPDFSAELGAQRGPRAWAHSFPVSSRVAGSSPGMAAARIFVRSGPGLTSMAFTADTFSVSAAKAAHHELPSAALEAA